MHSGSRASRSRRYSSIGLRDSPMHVLGEVHTPGPVKLTTPTTVIQAIALAGNWHSGGSLRHVAVFCRTADWRLVTTRLNLMRTLNGKDYQPNDEIWLRGSSFPRATAAC